MKFSIYPKGWRRCVIPPSSTNNPQSLLVLSSLPLYWILWPHCTCVQEFLYSAPVLVLLWLFLEEGGAVGVRDLWGPAFLVAECLCRLKGSTFP